MFVKALTTVCASTLTFNISHNSSQIYYGTIANIPFYLLNETVIEIGISGTALTVKI